MQSADLSFDAYQAQNELAQNFQEGDVKDAKTQQYDFTSDWHYKSKMQTNCVPSSMGPPFCLLCLRECIPDMTVRFGTKAQADCLNAFVCQRMLKNVTGFNIKLKHRTVCQTCWKLVEMWSDFKDCCLKAESKSKHLSEGMKYDEDTDSWLSSGTLAMLEQTHRAIREHADRIEPEVMQSVEVNELEDGPHQIEMEQAVIKEEPAEEDTAEAELNEDMEEDMRMKLQPVVEMREEPSKAKHSFGELQYYRSNEHQPETLIADIGQVMLECSKCGKVLHSKAALTIHSAACDGTTPKESKYNCTLCSAKFEKLRSLDAHMNKHKGIKPYKCRFGCETAYYNIEIRRSHEAMCYSERRVCAICGLGFKNSVTLNTHMKTVHVEATQECTTCGKKFRSRQLLNKHMLVHSDERNYSCHVCGKSFKSSYAHKVHQRIHTQEKPFQCALCGMAFAYKCLLKTHSENHHGTSIV